MRLTLEQQAHEAKLTGAAEALGRALDRGERKKLKVQLYKLIAERDPAVVQELEADRLKRAAR
jgi:hypothetical protein